MLREKLCRNKDVTFYRTMFMHLGTSFIFGNSCTGYFNPGDFKLWVVTHSWVPEMDKVGRTKTLGGS